MHRNIIPFWIYEITCHVPSFPRSILILGNNLDIELSSGYLQNDGSLIRACWHWNISRITTILNWQSSNVMYQINVCVLQIGNILFYSRHTLVNPFKKLRSLHGALLPVTVFCAPHSIYTHFSGDNNTLVLFYLLIVRSKFKTWAWG